MTNMAIINAQGEEVPVDITPSELHLQDLTDDVLEELGDRERTIACLVAQGFDEERVLDESGATPLQVAVAVELAATVVASKRSSGRFVRR